VSISRENRVIKGDNDMSFVAVVQHSSFGNTLRYYWKTLGTSTWHPELIAETIFSAPSAAQADNSVAIAAQGPTIA
jgi:hypothetical protein